MKTIENKKLIIYIPVRKSLLVCIKTLQVTHEAQRQDILFLFTFFLEYKYSPCSNNFLPFCDGTNDDGMILY